MRFSVSDTAEYGDYIAGPRIVDDHVRRTFRELLTEIQDGTFARRWLADADAGYPEFRRLREADRQHDIELVGSALRSKMSWLDPVEVREGQAQAAATRQLEEATAT
jgi:ketol-acid reductoisomerase